MHHPASTMLVVWRYEKRGLPCVKAMFARLLRQERAVSASVRRLTRGGALAAGAALALGGAARNTGAAPTKRDVQVLQFALVLEQVEQALYSKALERESSRASCDGTRRRHSRRTRARRVHQVHAREQHGPGGHCRCGGTRTQCTDVHAGGDPARGRRRRCVQRPGGEPQPGVLAAAARIVSVEARHAAWNRDIAGQPPAADPVDPALTAAQARPPS